ncbi:MAG: hypothetical protein U0350_25625 [Caldilineaceae bacterium]
MKDSSANLDGLAFKFFKKFARFEYALKATQFHRGDGEAKPNWDMFADSIAQVIEEPSSQLLTDALDYLLNNPPKKQIIRSGLLEWEAKPPSANSKARLVFLYIRRVRNNLFHGGKFNEHWFEPERSEQLIQHSLAVLEESLFHSPEVKKAYNG